MTKFKVCFVHFRAGADDDDDRNNTNARALTHTRTNRHRVKRWRIMHTRKTSSMSFVYEMISMHFVWFRQSCCHLIVTKFRWTIPLAIRRIEQMIDVRYPLNGHRINQFISPTRRRSLGIAIFSGEISSSSSLVKPDTKRKKRKYLKMTSFWRNIINEDDDVEKQTREWLESSVM